MAETFYTVLGVEDDADADAIRSAYREQVKRHHPDVSDDPDAPERFKRLTTAKEVLVDDGERRRYDRLGHADYVRQHVESGVWSVDSTTSTDAAERSPTGGSTPGTNARRGRTGTSRGRSHTTSGGQDYDRTAWMGEDGQSSTGRGRNRGRRRNRARATGTTASAEDWQRASQAYRRADTDVGTGEDSFVRSFFSGLVSVGPWLFVHLVFVASAAATAYLAVVQADSHLDVSWPTLLGGVLLLGVVVFASVLHVVSQVYS